jgi:hypothetical protein
MGKLIAALVVVALLCVGGAVAIDAAGDAADASANMTTTEENVKDEVEQVGAQSIEVSGLVVVPLLAIGFVLAGIATLG